MFLVLNKALLRFLSYEELDGTGRQIGRQERRDLWVVHW